MPLKHTRSFRVRHYECDAFGHLNNTNYLRYMQEAAFDASAAAGYGLARYHAMGYHWLVRETEIEYLRPVYYGDTVEVTTWIADFRRVQSRRAYEFHMAGAGELVAQAFTNWVFLNSATGALATIPQQLMADFFPEGPPAGAPPRARLPEPPPPPPGVFKIQRRVAWQDLDMARHVNNAVYLSYAEDCAIQAVAASGWPFSRMMAEGFAVLMRRHHIQYLQPAVLDDQLEVATWLSDVRRATALRHYTITRATDGALLARMQTLGVWVNLATGQPSRFPPAFLADFAPTIA